MNIFLIKNHLLKHHIITFFVNNFCMLHVKTGGIFHLFNFRDESNKEDLLRHPETLSPPVGRPTGLPSLQLYVESDDSMAHEEQQTQPPNRANVRSFSTDIY